MAKNTAVSIHDLLRRPVFKAAKLAAGRNGLERSVKWVHILEITNVAPYVSKDDLILSTGLWMKEAKGGLTYLEQLIRQEASGLCIELGTSITEIPEAIVEYCERHDFPLIVFAEPVRFVTITQDIHGLLINQQHQLLKSLEQFSRRFQKLTLATTDVSAVLRLLHEFTNKQVAYISFVETNRFYPKAAPELSHAIAAAMKPYAEQDMDSGEPAVLRLDRELNVMLHPIVCFEQTLAYIGVLQSRRHEPGDTTVVMLDYAAQSIGTMLLRTLFKEEKIQRDQNRLVLDIMERRVEDEDEARTRMGLRVRGKESYWFAGGLFEIAYGEQEVVQEQKESDYQDFVVLLRALLKKQGLYGLLAAQENRIHVLIAKERINEDSARGLEKSLLRLRAELDEFALSRPQRIVMHAGFGRFRYRLTELHAGIREARQALEVSRDVTAMKNVLFYERLGIYQLLKAIPDPAVHRSFVDAHLGALIAHDKDNSYQLIDTLDAYFKCAGSKQDTANRLFIHRQTLYHRIGKLTEILGEDFFDPERRICLEMALLMYRSGRE
ncbi:PucR family transcriptional regulator [Paenibacillus methanolicus]|uniref:Purine catabolism regulator n=1 Tax=Paenibacillus methanolicus TaxID=582686 RepID=A0A5S5CIH0_9BACL|nr:PucR family transcriptional regulator ligand-binding domain-containing protein [Paenibacillus methanolicus]TYP79512.1 purine catabolism regulator [Paenibacillus methanolicus]